MRLTRKVFTDLALFMMGFGLIIGIIFPFFMLFIGIPRHYILTLPFVLSCIAAGILVGAMNILIARSVVGRRISSLSGKMKYIEHKLSSARSISDLEDCTDETCRLPVDSEDELGESARSFNSLVAALSNSIAAEAAVRDFTAMLASQLELESLTKHALSHLLAYLQAEAGVIIIERGGELEISSSYGISDGAELLKNQNLWKVMEGSDPRRIILDESLAIDGMLVNFRPREITAVPILHKEVSLGMLLIASSRPVDTQVLHTLELFTRSLSLALNNAITYDQLQKLAANDPLTGLYNRRFGMMRLNEEFSRAVRTKLPVALIMFDIDHFKRVNDTYGHIVGDRVLVNLAKICSMAIRKGDFAVRYGGEEFMVILPGASKKDCIFIAERLRHMVEESVIQMGESQIRVTISTGAVSYPEYECASEYELIKIADKFLYIAKERGRNQVVSD